MEPLSARGLPRLSWIDTLYSSTYPSILLFTPLHTSLPIYLHSRLYLMPFYPATPLLLHLMGCLFVLQPELHAHREHFAFSLDFQLVGITVAVHNKTSTPNTQSRPRLCSP